MLKELVNVLKADGNPIEYMNYKMGKTWKKVIFSDEEVKEIEKYLSLMSPMEHMFSMLNTEKESSLHLVLPVLMVKNIFKNSEEYSIYCYRECWFSWIHALQILKMSHIALQKI